MKADSFIGGKNVSLVGFDSLDKAELEAVRKIMAVEIRKIEERTDYNQLRIRLKTHPHGKSFIHEFDAELFLNSGKSLDATASDKNIFRGLTTITSKLISEISHLERKSPRQHPIKKITKV
jgi:hypothetical protein